MDKLKQAQINDLINALLVCREVLREGNYNPQWAQESIEIADKALQPISSKKQAEIAVKHANEVS